MSGTLKELRDTWEKGLEVKIFMECRSVSICILQDEDDLYHIHRYFTINPPPFPVFSTEVSETWHISVDLQGGTIDNMWLRLQSMSGYFK